MASSSTDSVSKLPGTFVFELTRRCNHRCSYCYTFWGADLNKDEKELPDLEFAQFIKFVNKLRSELPVSGIAFSGGEPLFHPDLSDMLEYLRWKGIGAAVISNGTLITPERANMLREAAVVEVTLLSHQPAVHDRIVRREGAWNAAVQGMANLREAKAHWIAVFIATKINLPDLRKTVELAIGLGTEGLMFNRLNLGKRNAQFGDELLPEPEMLAEALAILDEMAEKYSFPVAVSVPIEPCVLDTAKYLHINFGFCPAGGEKSYFTIDPAGDIRICNHSPVVLGNIMRDSFVEIYNSHPHVQQFRDVWPQECADCAPAMKERCRGGCRAAAEQCLGSAEHVDPYVTWARTRTI